MASRNRLRKEANAILVRQFTEWNLPLDIDYKSYAQLVDRPVTPHHIRKSFYNWRTAVHSVRLAGYLGPKMPVPMADDPIPAEPASPPEAKPVVDDALAALAAATVKED